MGALTVEVYSRRETMNTTRNTKLSTDSQPRSSGGVRGQDGPER